jgi:hypothetical protein
VKRVFLFLLAVVCAAASDSTAAAQTPDLLAGTWTVNLSRSSFTSGPAPYKRLTCTIERAGERVRVVYDMVRTRGGVTHLEWTGRIDGAEYPVQGVDYVLTNAYNRIDDRTFDVVQRIDGGPSSTSRLVVSPDGRTITTTATARDVRGRVVVNRTVYERITAPD